VEKKQNVPMARKIPVHYLFHVFAGGWFYLFTCALVFI